MLDSIAGIQVRWQGSSKDLGFQNSDKVELAKLVYFTKCRKRYKESKM